MGMDATTQARLLPVLRIAHLWQGGEGDVEGFHCGALSRPRLNEHSEYIQTIVKNCKVNIFPRLHRQFFIFKVTLQLTGAKTRRSC